MDNKQLRIIFMATPEIATKTLLALINEKYNVVAVVTKKRAKVGRKQIIKKTPIHLIAEENNIDVLELQDLKNEAKEIFNHKPDLLITYAYGKIIPKKILEYPLRGAINIHASLLPKYRGGAPIQHAIINGETETGLTIMKMEEGLDSGPIAAQLRFPITLEDTTETIHNKMMNEGPKLLLECLDNILDGTMFFNTQIAGATLAPNITREDEQLDFNKTGQEVLNKIRGLYSWPLANAKLDGKEIKILEAVKSNQKFDGKPSQIKIIKQKMYVTVSDGTIEILRLKPFSKKAMATKDFINGYATILHDKEFNA